MNGQALLLLCAVSLASCDGSLRGVQHTRPVDFDVLVYALGSVESEGKIGEALLRAAAPLLPADCPEHIWIPRVKITRGVGEDVFELPTPTYDALRDKSSKPRRVMDEDGRVLRGFALEALTTAPLPTALLVRAPELDQATSIRATEKVLAAERGRGTVVVLRPNDDSGVAPDADGVITVRSPEEEEVALGRVVCRALTSGEAAPRVAVVIPAFTRSSPAELAPLKAGAPATPDAPVPRADPVPSSRPSARSTPPPAPDGRGGEAPHGRRFLPRPEMSPASPDSAPALCEGEGSCFKKTNGSLAGPSVREAILRRNADGDSNLNARPGATLIAPSPLAFAPPKEQQ